MQLLLIEKAMATADRLGGKLQAQGFRPHYARNVKQAISDGLTNAVSAILVMQGSESAEGIRVTTGLRSAGVSLPLVIISALSNWREAVACLDAGADAYIVMPVRSEEVAARLRVAIRRQRGMAGDRIASGELELDLNTRCCWLAGQSLELTRREFAILQILLLNLGAVVSHETLRAALSTGRHGISGNAIEVHIARLRKKVGQDAIRTIRGIGYRYLDEAEREPGETLT